MGRLILWSVAAVASVIGVLGAPVAHAQPAAEKRVALVIGNAAYRDVALKNPVSDARAMTTRLRALGFDVKTVENGTLEQMGRAVVEFGSRLSPGATALFFYAGHGIQSRGRNYLIPVDAGLSVEGDLRYQAVDVTGLIEEIQQSQSRLGFVILDACRNNPFERRFRGAPQGSGLAAIDAARGMLIAYATSPGSVASDGEGDNGVYTSALMRALETPGLTAEEVFKRARVEVVDRTRNQQTPWESSSLTGDFVFNVTINVAAPAAPAPVPAGPPADREALFWYSIQSSTTVADFEDYLRRFPQGDFAGLARNRIANLQSVPRVAAVPAPVATPAPVAPATPAASPVPPPAPGFEIELLDGEYVARSVARMRAAPDARGAVLGSLREGDVVRVVGRVRGRDWMQIDRRGQGPAFVNASLLEEAGPYRQRLLERQQAEAAAKVAPARPTPVPASPPRPNLAAVPPAPVQVAPQAAPVAAPVPPPASVPQTSGPLFDGTWTGGFPCEYLGAKELRLVIKDGTVTEFAAGRHRRSGIRLSAAGDFGVDFDNFQNTLLLRGTFDPRQRKYLVSGTAMFQGGETCRAELTRN